MTENLKNNELDNDACSGTSAAAGCPQLAGQRGKKRRRLFRQTIFYDWCKACGICIAFCPQQVFSKNEQGKPQVVRADACIGCGFCEIHCPDFAITVTERDPESEADKS